MGSCGTRGKLVGLLHYTFIGSYRPSTCNLEVNAWTKKDALARWVEALYCVSVWYICSEGLRT